MRYRHLMLSVFWYRCRKRAKEQYVSSCGKEIGIDSIPLFWIREHWKFRVFKGTCCMQQLAGWKLLWMNCDVWWLQSKLNTFPPILRLSILHLEMLTYAVAVCFLSVFCVVKLTFRMLSLGKNEENLGPFLDPTGQIPSSFPTVTMWGLKSQRVQITIKPEPRGPVFLWDKGPRSETALF